MGQKMCLLENFSFGVEITIVVQGLEPKSRVSWFWRWKPSWPVDKVQEIGKVGGKESRWIVA
jgi:hypothetical protein